MSQVFATDSFKVTIEGNEVSPVEALSLYIQHKSPSFKEKEAGEWLLSLPESENLWFGNTVIITIEKIVVCWMG